MIAFTNPWVIIIFSLAIGGSYSWGHHKGWGDRDQEMQLEISRKNAESRKKEQELNEKLNDQTVQLKEANNVLDQKQSALDRAIRAGRVRVSAPTSCLPTSPSPAPAAGDRDQAPSQPDRQADGPSDTERATLQAIAELVAQGDRNTQQLNACIDAYNKIREAVNGQR